MIVEEHDGAALLDGQKQQQDTSSTYKHDIEISNKLDVTHPLRPPLDRISIVGNKLFIPHDLVYKDEYAYVSSRADPSELSCDLRASSFLLVPVMAPSLLSFT
jgi:hypothetical protein